MIHERVRTAGLRRASDLFLEASMAHDAGLFDVAYEIEVRARRMADEAMKPLRVPDHQQLTLPLELRCPTW